MYPPVRPLAKKKIRFCCEVRGQASCFGWWCGLGARDWWRSGLLCQPGPANLAAARGGWDGMEGASFTVLRRVRLPVLLIINTECGRIVRAVV